MNEYIHLSYWQVALSALLILVNGLISLCLRLGLERQLFVAALRMTVQLALVGYILHWVFSLGQWLSVIGILLAMTLTAGVAAVGRTEHRYPGIWSSSIISVWASSWAVGALALLVIVRVEPWFRPQYAIPLLGMVLGNTLNGISLGLDRFSGELDARQDHVETLLAVGASRWEAAQKPIREAIRTGMIPILNAMAIAGVVSLPGMMTGQLLAGVDPIEAAKYQIVIMFLIASGTALGTVGVVLLSYRRLFNAHHQFMRAEIRGPQ